MPPRPSVGRSSFAIAMKDYTFIRPGIAVTISAATLLIAFIFGLDLIHSCCRGRSTEYCVRKGAQVSQTLHSYSAAYEVWHQMATSADPAYQASGGRDPAGCAEEPAPDRARSVGQDAERHRGPGAGADHSRGSRDHRSRAEHQRPAGDDRPPRPPGRAALFDAAEASQHGVLLAAMLLGLTVIAAATLVVPMAFLYIRYKRGATIEVKV